MITYKYYGIYMTYPLWASWCSGPHQKTLHLGAEFDQ
jgi:hypothetical protein